MVRVPILAVQKGKGIIVELDLEMRQQGTGAHFLDARLYADDDIRQALNTAFSLLHLKGRMYSFVSREAESIACAAAASHFQCILGCMPAHGE